ncbi:unnamed protein product [Linum trigynum]|uniref:thymidine kinase n=1 Tax=Linum trigynum TaxID=586398 RepID=A0AAV2F785_9ROSI
MFAVSKMKALFPLQISHPIAPALPHAVAFLSAAPKSALFSIYPAVTQFPASSSLRPIMGSSGSMFSRVQNGNFRPAEAAGDSTTSYPSGEIHVIVGPMFAGKTTSLLRRVQAESENGRLNEAVSLLWRTESPVDDRTYSLMLKECILTRRYKTGRRIHSQMIVVGHLPTEYLKTKLLILYAKCGDLRTALVIFNKLIDKTLISWNAMISGYVQNGLEQVGLSLYAKMRRNGLMPDPYTFSSLFRACGTLALLELGKQTHSIMIKCNVKDNVVVNSALIDMYFKCSDLVDGQKVFNEMPNMNVVTWTSLISGYGQHGRVEEVLELFSRMKEEGFRPDHVTFLAVLSACGHGGLIDQGWDYFSSMKDYGIEPRWKHYAAMVDLLGRAGKLQEAYDFVLSSPLKDHSDIWGALLGACRIHGDTDLASIAARKFLELEPGNAGKYVVLSNAYATRGFWDRVKDIRGVMRELDIMKEPAYSWIEIQGVVHVFSTRDKSHRKSEEIQSLILEMTSILKDDVCDLEIDESVAVVKSDKDTRYGLDSIVTHDGLKFPCWSLPELSMFRHSLGVDAYNQLDVIGIDEAQFFGDLYDFCREAADQDGKTVIIAGLDGDYMRSSFGAVLDIIPLADSVTKLTARFPCQLRLSFNCKLMSRWANRKLVSCPTIQLKVFPRIPSIILTPPTSHRYFSDSQLELKGSNEENEWERLLKPFDLKELRRTLSHRITPFQLCKLLHLPLDVSISMELFNRVGAQKGYMHTFDVYYALIDKLGGSNDFKSIDKLLVQMKEEGIVFRESLFIMIMKHYGRAGFPGQATRLLLDMKNVYCCHVTFKSYNVVLEILVAGNCPVVASNVFYDMLSRGISPNVYTFGVVMKGLCMVNEVDNACSLLRDMTKHGCVPNSIVYQTLIHALSKRDRVDEALKLLEEMFLMGCRPDLDTFNDVVYGLCRVKRIHEGAKLIDRMVLRGFIPNGVTYGYLMDGLCRSGKVDEAFSLLNEVPSPSVVHFNIVINGYVKSGRLDEAKEILCGRMINSGFIPDLFTFNILICGLCRKGLFGSALEIVDEMGRKGVEPNVNTFTALIDGFCKKGRIEEASQIYEEMSAKGLGLNTLGYNTILHALCKCGNMSEVMQIFGEMSSKGCKPDIFTFNTLIFGLCKANIMEDAMRLFHDMVLEGVIADSVTYNTLIHAFLRRNDIQEAIKLMNDMVFRGCALSETTYNGLIRALCTAGAVEKGLGLFDEMIRKGLVPSNISVNIVINGLCRAGQMNNAMELLRDMIHRGIEPDIVTFNSLINGFCKMGRVDEALNIFHKLVVEGIQPDAVTYNTLVCWHCRKGMVDDAYSLLDRGVKNKFIPNQVTWNILVHNIVKDGK